MTVLTLFRNGRKKVSKLYVFTSDKTVSFKNGNSVGKDTVKRGHAVGRSENQ